MPGPLAAQLAMWIGFLRQGFIGASLVGLVFILPPFLIVLAIAWLYVAYNGLSQVQALFYGIGPMVIAIVIYSAVRLARTTVGQDWRLWGVFGLLAVITVFARTEIALLFLVSALAGILMYSPPRQWRRAAKSASRLLILPAIAGTVVTLPLLFELGRFFITAG